MCQTKAPVILKLQLIPLHHEGATQIRIDQQHPAATLSEIHGNVDRQPALSISGIIAGDEDPLQIAACKGQIGTDRIQRFGTIVIQRRELVDPCLLHAHACASFLRLLVSFFWIGIIPNVVMPKRLSS